MSRPITSLGPASMSLCRRLSFVRRLHYTFIATTHTSPPHLLSDALLDLLPSLDAPPLQVLIFPLKTLLILRKCTMHHSIEVLLDFLHILFCAHKSLHKDIKFF